MNLRLVAAKVVNQVTHGHSLADCLEPALSEIKDLRDRALVQAICYGVCRFYTRLDVALSFLLKKPMEAKDSDVHALLLVGLYQLMDMRIPPHAAVSETVNATDKLKKSWSRGLINAILREYLRRQEDIKQKLALDEESEYAHPAWWIEKIKQDWPNDWQQILAANNEHPPFTIRVNQQHLSRTDYLAVLHEQGIEAEVAPATLSGVILAEARSVESLPGFSNGDVSVQDGAAQLAAELLELLPGLRVLDACSAPGGKLTHILETQPELNQVVAVEKEFARLRTIKENLERLKLSAECICHDVADTKKWWDNQLFDRILLDAPCSASGVIRRHPDIKLLREPEDIPTLADEQLQLLEALWPLLKPNGLLVYATCSIFHEENSQVLKQFLAAHQDAKEEKILAEWGIPCQIGRQILPGMQQMDGFYYARLRKQ